MDILLVEDNAGTRRPLALLLAAAGHTVRAVGSVAAARAELAAARPPPDAAVVNRVLPDGDELGPELAAAGIPGVAFSGLAYPADVRDCLAAGFAANVTKPAGAEAVPAAVAAAVTRR